MKKIWRKSRGAVGVSALAWGGLTACGTDFSAGCEASRTCPRSEGGDASAGAGSSPEAATAAQGEAGETALGTGNDEQAGGAGGAGNAGGANGAELDSELVLRVNTVSPRDGAKDVEPEVPIVVAFNAALDPSTVNDASVKLYDGAEAVSGTVSYADGVLTFKPTSNMRLLRDYRLEVSASVLGSQGEAGRAFSSKFTTRDGVWKTVEVVGGVDLMGAVRVSDLTSDGRLLTAWLDGSKADCGGALRWFRNAAPASEVVPFGSIDKNCGLPAVAVNASGLAGVGWRGSLLRTQQFRSGAWQATDESLFPPDPSINQVDAAVSPLGIVTVFGQGPKGTTAWHTNQFGEWQPSPDVLSSDAPLSRVSVAYDANGNGIAVWTAVANFTRPEILASRFLVSEGRWSPATLVPDANSASPNVSVFNFSPRVRMAPSGDAMVVWVQRVDNVGERLNTSAFVAGKWAAASTPVQVKMTSMGDLPPALVFDRDGFVAAWVARPPAGGAQVCEKNACVYTARWDASSHTWSEAKLLASDATSQITPLLATDGLGQLVLVRVPVVTPGATDGGPVVYQRGTSQAWESPQPIPNVTVKDPSGLYSLTLSMNPGGLMAVTYGQFKGTDPTGLRLASFF